MRTSFLFFPDFVIIVTLGMALDAAASSVIALIFAAVSSLVVLWDRWERVEEAWRGRTDG